MAARVTNSGDQAREFAPRPAFNGARGAVVRERGRQLADRRRVESGRGGGFHCGAERTERRAVALRESERESRVPSSRAPRLEVHEHCYVSGPRAHGSYKFSHSHEGGDVPHQHPDCGPASYTIDKDDWLRATGLRGGGRKTFTAAPRGEQLPIESLEDCQRTFEVVICDPPKDYRGEGPGIALPARLALQFGLRPIVRGDA